VIAYDHGQVIEDSSLIGRVGFAGIPWSADLVLNDTRVSDAGIYRCMVNNPPEVADPGVGELVLSVLAPPSLPACQWDGDVDVGGSITLSCLVTGGVPTPELQWDKLNPEEISLPINMEGQYKKQTKKTKHGGSVKKNMEGQYKKNMEGQYKKNMEGQ
ncbi:hypothetical protein LDENG_00260770, partial [Lucifuga dentata]